MLFCKPPARKGLASEDILNPGSTITFRSLVIKKDLNIIFQWTGTEASKKYRRSFELKEELQSFYQSVIKNPDAHSFIGLLDEQLICLADIYRVSGSDLGKHMESYYDDCVMQLLMAPQAVSMTGLYKETMEAFTQYYFSFAPAMHLYAEPDIHDNNACRVLERSGFLFIRNIMLADKAASLYLMTRKQLEALQQG